MGSEVLLYAYGTVCVAMLIFNIVYNIKLNGDDKLFDYRVNKFTNLIDKQLEILSSKNNIEAKHISLLDKKLRHINNLIAYNEILEKVISEDKIDKYKLYFDSIDALVLKLALYYNKRNNMEAAYFAYFISRYSLVTKGLEVPLEQLLVSYMTKKSLYCRLNALNALYNYGNEERIFEAICLLDKQNDFIHDKLLCDGLLTFKGDHKYLIELFWNKFYTFSHNTQLAILNYVRFKTGDYKNEILFIMNNEKMNKELRLAAIRYFEKYPDDKALKSLIKYAQDEDLVNWEYCAISLSALSKYKNEFVKDILFNCLHSKNYYIRRNAAMSLKYQKINHEDILNILNSDDLYAKEMMVYNFKKEFSK